jgi:hypothetical protein
VEEQEIPLKSATRDDGRIEPMPSQYASLLLQTTFSQEEFAQIAAGLIPESMDNHWFIYYEALWLSLHRSWTGYCIYRVRFEPMADGMQVVEALANRNPVQHREESATRDTALLSILLDSRAKRNVRDQMLQYIKQQGEHNKSER